MDKVNVEVVKPLFKNGKEIPVGTKMLMEIDTAFRFSQLGDLKITDEVEVVVEEVKKAIKIK